jgi:hypothetical protein
LVALLGACNNGDVGDAPERHRINEQTATYRGIGLGNSRRQVTAALGKADPFRNDPAAPLRRPDANLAPAFDCKTGQRRGPHWGETLRYEQVTFIMDGGRVCDFIVTEAGAATNRGVAIGDQLEDSEAAYSDIKCGIANEGSEYPQFPYCAGYLGPRRFIWFGGDPIDTIQMNTERFG